MQVERDELGNSFLRLKGTLGSLLLCWCGLEAVLSGSVRDLGLDENPTAIIFAKKIEMIRLELTGKFRGKTKNIKELDDMMAVLDLARRSRNLIVHHMVGISCDPDKGEPHVFCSFSAGDGSKFKTFTQSELDKLLEEIDRCRSQLAGMVNAAKRLSI